LKESEAHTVATGGMGFFHGGKVDMADFDPRNEDDVKRLKTAVQWSWREMESYRTHRIRAIRQFVGKRYSNSGATQEVPLPYLALAVMTYRKKLAAGLPKVQCHTEHDSLRTKATKLELALNHILEFEIGYRETKRLAVLNAMFGQAIVKIGVSDGHSVKIDGILHDAGQPYCDLISTDDWIQHMRARRWEQLGFCGHRYLVDIDIAREMAKKGGEDLEPNYRTYANEDGSDRAEKISRGNPNQDGEFRKQIELQELWLPRENLIITLPVEGPETAIIGYHEYQGPENGPYRRLHYGDVPDQLMPLPPSSLWIPLHEFANSLFRKIAGQANRQKSQLVYHGNPEDAQKVTEFQDGAAFGLDSPQNLKEVKWGGYDAQNFALSTQMRDFISWFCGNLDSLAALSPQAETLGQEEILQAGTQGIMGEMIDLTREFDRGVARDIGWYFWHDPLYELPLTYRVKGTSLKIPMRFTAEDREADYYEFNIDIDPYSTTADSPASRLKEMQSFLQDTVPMLPMMAQQGISLNFENVLRLRAKYGGMEDLDRLITFIQPQEAPQGPVETSKPATTERRNIRINKPGRTRNGADTALVQAALGGTPQATEMEAAIRP